MDLIHVVKEICQTILKPENEINIDTLFKKQFEKQLLYVFKITHNEESFVIKICNTR